MNLPVLSASQIDTYKDCPRKWAWNKIEGLEQTQAASAELGEMIHTQLERHLLGYPMDFTVGGKFGVGRPAELAATAIHLLPPPRFPGLRVEDKFDKVDLSAYDNPGYLFSGRIDWCLIADLKGDGPELIIGDHKSTSDIAAWAKTPEVLRTDTQAIIYARYGLTHLAPHLEKVSLQWTYIQTRNRKISVPVTIDLTRAEVSIAFESIEATAREMVEVRQSGKRALDLAPNPDTCEKYGGCSFQGNCNLSPFQRLRSIASQFGERAARQTNYIHQSAPKEFTMSTQHTGLSAMVKRNEHGHVISDLRGRALPPGMTASGYIKNPGGSDYKLIDPIGPEIAQMLDHWATEYERNPAAFQPAPQVQAPPYQPPAPPPFQAPPPAANPQAAPPWGAPAPQAPPQGPGWAPPGMTPPPAYQPPQTPPQAPQFTPPAMTGPINPPEWQPPPPNPAQQAANPAPAPAEEKRGPGRPKGSKNKPAETPAQNPQVQAPWAQPGAAPVAPVAPPAPQAPQNGDMVEASGPSDERIPMTVYVDCLPIKGGGHYHSFDTFVAKANVRIWEENKLCDYTIAGFGNGPGIVSDILEELIRAEAGISGGNRMSLYVNSRTREAQVFLNRLTAMAETVVKGV